MMRSKAKGKEKEEEEEVIVIDDDDDDDVDDVETVSCRAQRARANARMRRHYEKARKNQGAKRDAAIVDSLKEGMKVMYYARQEAEMCPHSAISIVKRVFKLMDKNIERLQHYIDRDSSCTHLLKLLSRQKTSLLLYYVHNQRARKNGLITYTSP